MSTSVKQVVPLSEVAQPALAECVQAIVAVVSVLVADTLVGEWAYAAETAKDDPNNTPIIKNEITLFCLNLTLFCISYYYKHFFNY